MRPLVLSLFPGLGLLDRAFELEGFTVVRGPDILFGGDIRRMHVPAGVFAGVIGGPPCQKYSTAGNIVGTDAVDLIPEFVRIVDEAEPDFVGMENVRGAVNHPGVPASWHPARLKDWDCGGLTSRLRYFWTWPFPMLEPCARPGEPSYSVMASTAKRGNSQYAADKGFLPGNLSIPEYERLQGAEGLTSALVAAGCLAVSCRASARQRRPAGNRPLRRARRAPGHVPGSRPACRLTWLYPMGIFGVVRHSLHSRLGNRG